ncbi:SDR family NAD(P)-dependent oxidoreductase [Aeromicrobium panaciterrae]|uniref:SDR family NAD(P)-dependent oxidoreductase n=1 Tax=Aeromicrobium panaciterrae TaxID=363861 RepID=UPI0031CF5072
MARTDGRLRGRVALVTGSTHGIGRATAARFAAEGADLVITGRDEAAGASAAEEVSRLGEGRAVFVPADVTDETAVAHLVKRATEEFGRIDILVNNAAGIDQMRQKQDGAAHNLDLDTVRRLLDVNLVGVLAVVKHVVPVMMRQDHGSIINISSVAAHLGHPGIDTYTAAKGAIISLTRSFAVEYAPHGIRTNCVVIGFVPHDDERATHQPGMAGPPEVFLDVQLTRLGIPDDIARASLFFATDEDSGFVTGQTLIVDGGVSARSPLVSRVQKYTVD